jgi:hypothetical protein
MFSASPNARPKDLSARRQAQRLLRPTLEQLEDRIALSVDITYGGGPTIPHVQVTNIVMGTPLVDTTSIMQAVVKDYLPLLGPDYGIGSGTIQGSVSVPAPSSNPTYAQLDGLITTEIQSGAVPVPGPNQVYMIFLAPGQYVAGSEGGYGHVSFSVNGVTAYYAFAPGTYQQVYGGASATAGSAMTDTVTDPEFNGWNDQNLKYTEVGDIYGSDFPAPGFLLDGNYFDYLSGPQGQYIPPLPPAPPPPPSLPPPVGGGTVGQGFSSPTFFQAAITLYIDGVERILQGDSAALEQSIQANLPYAVFVGIDLGDFFVLSGELAAINVLHGNNNGGNS